MSAENVPAETPAEPGPYLTLNVPAAAAVLGCLLPRRTDDPNYLALDLVAVNLPDGTTIDVDWIPEHDPTGRFRVVVFRAHWADQVEPPRFTADPAAARDMVEEIAERRCAGHATAVALAPPTAAGMTEEEFHRRRRMFAVRAGTVLVAPPETVESHAEWLYSLLGVDAGRAAMADWVRGYVLEGGLVAYKGDDFSHRLDLADVAAAVRLFAERRTAAGGMGLDWVGLGAKPGTGQPWQPRVRLTVMEFLLKAGRSAGATATAAGG